MREIPVTKMWYSKAARFKSTEEWIDQDPEHFIWAVDRFLDVTPKQAEYFKNKWGMDLPQEVVRDVEPFNPDLYKTHREKDEAYLKAHGLEKWPD